jgi:hypothetical protein
MSTIKSVGLKKDSKELFIVFLLKSNKLKFMKIFIKERLAKTIRINITLTFIMKYLYENIINIISATYFLNKSFFRTFMGRLLKAI